MSKYALIIDYKYCTGCHSCEVACRKEKDIPLDQWGIKLTEHLMRLDGGKTMWNFIPVPSDPCDVCEERIEAGRRPSCVVACLGACMTAVKLEDISAAVADKKNERVAVFIPS